MPDESPGALESFVLAKGWMTKAQLDISRSLESAHASRGMPRALAEVALEERYLTAEQFAELTSEFKIPMACPSCAGRFKVGGKRPEGGFGCPKCKAPLRAVAPDRPAEPAPAAPAAPEPVAAPAPLARSVPGRGLRSPRAPRTAEASPESAASAKRKKAVLFGAGGAGVAILLVVGLVMSSGDAPHRGIAEGPADRGPSTADRSHPRGGAEEDRKGTGDAGASQSPAGAAASDEQTLREIRGMMAREDWRGASGAIRARLIDLGTAPGLIRELTALRAQIVEKVSPRYEDLAKAAEQLLAQGKPTEARARVLEALSWGIPDLEARARRDAERLDPSQGPVPAAAAPDLRAIVAERAQEEFYKVQNRVEAMLREGRVADALKICEAYPDDYRDTPAGGEVLKLMERLKGRLGSPARAQGPPAPGTTTAQKAAAGAVIRTRGPRAGAFTPGGLSDEEKAKKQAELASAARKDQKGARKAAAQKRQEYLDKLEKEKGIYDVTTIVDKGDPSKRVDIVMVTSGFSKADAKKVDQMAESLKNSLLKVDPFQNYPDYINFHRIKIDDPPDRPHIPHRVAQNILTCDDDKALEYASYAPSYDLVVVMCNVKGVRSTGGPPIITIDADLDLGRTFLHEMGHAFASLNDEYVDTSLSGSRPYKDEEESDWSTNVCTVSNPKLARWHYWTLDVWPAAHDLNRLPPGHKVGCFEGGAYQPKGVWRPEEQCLMRMGDKYCVVCFEQVEKKFYRLIAPIDDMRPRRTLVPAWIDETITLEGDALKTLSTGERIGKFEGFWYVNAKPRHANAKNLTTILSLPAGELGPGQHEVGLRVDFSNKRIRRDDGWLSSSAAWKLDVAKWKKPKWDGPTQVQAKVGQPVAFDLKIENPDPASFRIEVGALPEGASYQDGRFSWTPGKASQGAWRPKFVLTDGLRSIERSVEIAVLDVGEKNFDPVFSVMEPRQIGEGEAAEIPLEVADVDGDNLVFSSPNLPDGAELDLYDGVIRWTPTAHQVGSFPGIQIDAWDGRHHAKGTIDLVVQSRPQRRVDPRTDLAVALRSGWPQIRARALRELGAQPQVYQFMEAARLLRDKSQEVRTGALGILEKLGNSAGDVFTAMMIRDLAPHAWHFTDHKEILAWLDALAAKGDPASPETKALRTALKLIDKYNKDRGAP